MKFCFSRTAWLVTATALVQREQNSKLWAQSRRAWYPGTGARAQAENRRPAWIYPTNCWRPERFALKGWGVQSAWWLWKCYYLQISKDFHGFLIFTVVFNVLMRTVWLFGVQKLQADLPGLNWLRARVVTAHLVTPEDKVINMPTGKQIVSQWDAIKSRQG